MNFAQAIDPERVLAMKERKEVRPAARDVRASEPVAAGPRWKKGEQRAAVVAAQRGKSLSCAELHATIGGNKDSLGVLLSVMNKAGELLVSGERGSFRYTVPA